MVREMKRQFALQGKDWLGFYLVMVGAGICGIVLIGGIFGTREGVAIGTLLALVTLVLIVIFAGAFQVGVGFQLALSMGGTRKWYLITYYLQLVAGTLIGTGVLAVMFTVERMLNHTIADLIFKDSRLLRFLIPLGILATLLITALATFFGALIMKYGKKAFWVLWCLWMLSALGIPAMLDAAGEGSRSILGVLGNVLINAASGLTTGMISGIGLVAWAICLVGAYLLLRKQQV